jgi:hypothetical protein
MAPRSFEKPPRMVRTPAGLVPEDKVSHVPPGKRVRRTPEGDYVIEDASVPAPDDQTGGQNGHPPSQPEKKDG